MSQEEGSHTATVINDCGLICLVWLKYLYNKPSLDFALAQVLEMFLGILWWWLHGDSKVGQGCDLTWVCREYDGRGRLIESETRNVDPVGDGINISLKIQGPLPCL